jgi:AcrR family transcriptional regulator
MMGQARRHKNHLTGPPGPSRLDQILDEAAKSLNSKGVSFTTLGEIADRRGVSRPALYYYVKDLEDLVFQTYRRSCEIISLHLGVAIETGQNASSVVAHFLDLALAEDAPEIAALGEIGILQSTARQAVLSLYEGAVARLSAVIDTGITRGELRPCDSEVTARALISIVFWLPVAPRWSSAIQPVSRDRLLKVAKDLLLHGWSKDRRAAPEVGAIDLAPLSTVAFSVFDQQSIVEEKRRRILATASRLFNRKGVDSTSLEEIAADIGTTKRALYSHVGDKQALLAACFRRSYEIFLHLLKSAYESDTSCLYRLTAYHEAASIVQLRDDIQPLRPTVGYESLTPLARSEVDELSTRLVREFATLFAGGIREGSLRDLDLEATMLILPGASSWLVKGVVVVDEEGQRHIAREISNLFTMGLCATTTAMTEQQADRD